MVKTMKWQRVEFMPGTGLGADGMRVTGCKEHIALSRAAAADGMVLLKNEDQVLPFTAGQKVAVFGKAQADYVKGGGGSGDVFTSYVISLLDGLKKKEDEGKLCIYAPLSDYYTAYVNEKRSQGVAPGFMSEILPDEKLLEEAAAFTDTAIFTICRFSEEGRDRTSYKFDGDFYLSKEEDDLRKLVFENFDHVIVVLNIGGVMDTVWFKNEPKVQGALLMWQGGMEGGLAAADILCGDMNPSGHLVDTFAESFEAYPGTETFHESDDYVEYVEDVFVGYRYFETIPGAGQKVCYPFGYGLSYTEFSVEDLHADKEDDEVVVTAKITNIGKMAGRQVLQVYCKAPEGKLTKPAKVLAGFAKTKCLEPGESQLVTIICTPYMFSSYDDTGVIEKSAYVLEKGCYSFYAGFNAADAEEIDFRFELEENLILERLSEHCAPKKLKSRMMADGSLVPVDSYEESSDAYGPIDDKSILPFDGMVPAEKTWEITYSLWGDPQEDRLVDVYEGKLTLDAFMENLTDEMKIHLLGGQPNRGPANTMGMGNIPRFGIPNVMTADGPAGLRFREVTGITTTAWPVATLLACTWDTELVEQVGHAAASEVLENGVGIWLAPAINIHRTPLCGRNFEYYSEDPMVAGKIAAAMVRGIQSVGVAATVKHFACNNKETNRRDSDSRLSERALREIYLKGFEICVKEANPWTIMTAYNIVNGVRASENKELLTDILRGEWGFSGLVMSDWFTYGEQFREINAGNDVKMGRGMPEQTLKKLESGELSREALDRSIRRVLEMILRIN